jgi:hypothetical protein
VKWYKHDASAHGDAKLERVRIKYGMEGYGLYWYCLELIAANVEQHNLSFELEHDAEIIAHRTGIHFERVQEMMTFMVDLGLFEQRSGVITCLKLAKRCDEYTSKLIRNLGGIPTVSGQSPDKVPPIRTEQNRLDKKRKTNTASSKSSFDFDELKQIYPKRAGDQGWSKATKACNARLKNGSTWNEILDGVRRYAAYCEATDIIGTQFVKQAASFCGPECHFTLPWDPPRNKAERKQDKTVNAAREFLNEA